MKFPSGLIIFVVFHFILYAECNMYTMKSFEDGGVAQESIINMQQPLVLFQDKQIPRKLLHEVHSGPNPIGNSIPFQRAKVGHLHSSHRRTLALY